ncbi:hypothetical protein ETB97_002310 [Aspergillus alliaceus]|uniref:RxLR effector protein n=1 Tax=Petromyces alliaceus TaxID=209559 RepID=A0A8H6AEK9_PETAA|nr:hypothetical protein ETB97_002310 [Aspergillus burnettii]
MKFAAILAFTLSTLALAAPVAPAKASDDQSDRDVTKELAKSLLGGVTKALKIGSQKDLKDA